MQIAQTNLQLYNQLVDQGRSDTDLSRVRNAYELAMTLFSGAYRASGKPFLAHLIGTASILAWLELSTDVVIAGLLHASFEAGDFADRESGVTAARKERLSKVLTPAVIELLIEYHRMPRAELMNVLSGADPVDWDPLRRQVVLMQLCDTLEEHADGAMNYAPNKNRWFDKALDGDAATCTVGAFARLGYERQSELISDLFATWASCRVPENMLSTRWGSYVVAPASYERKLRLRFRDRWERLQGKLERWKGRLSLSKSSSVGSPAQ